MLLFTDGFDSYGATSDLTTKWASNSNDLNVTYNATAGRFGGGAIELTGGSGNLTTQTVGSGTDRWCIGFWLKMSGRPSSNHIFLYLQLINASTSGDSVRFTLNASTGAIGYYRLWGLTNNLYWGVTDICDGNFHWIEIHSYINNSSGIARVQVDGFDEINFSGDTYFSGSTYNQQNRFSFYAPPGATMTIDDVVAWDDSVGTLTGDLRASNYPIGPTQIETLRPDGAGNSSQFTPSAGANYQCVDESVPNDDTDYVNSSTSGHKDLYTFSNLSSSPSTVHGVVINSYAKNTAAGNIEMKGSARSASTNASADSKLVGSNYRTQQWNIPQDPNTSTAWTGSGVDSAEFGIEVT